MKILYPDDTGESNDDMSLSGIFSKMFGNWVHQQSIAHM